ncbi:TonB-dependent receptor [Verticiella sediminum]|uniref:TonB-dependent receptor n=1 Tax=Verticiella sediminum TaxID=1247510 RepID=A0A556B267_9BURK|nr:TonB-dependent receptor [Verticiella sediminum]TSH99269.1 TonB-dependent receptor [Verticiella sediminum]
MAAVVSLAMAGGLFVAWQPVALAQNPTPMAEQAQRNQDRRAYDIPPGPLDETLARFARESDALLAATPEQVQGRTSPGARGTFGVQAALDALLAGTGLVAVPNAQGQFVLRQAADVTTLSAITVVSAAGYEQDIRDAPASISVITSQELEKRQFSSLQDIAREIPGVSVIGSGTQSGISIRGMEKGYTLVLVDGKRVRSETGNPRELNNEDLDSNFIPPLSSIERIEVIRGPMSSLYGSDAMGGVINVITKKTPETWSGSLGYGLRVPDSGSMGNQRQKNVYLSGPIVRDLLGISLWGNETDQDEDRYLGGYQESTKRTVGGRVRFTPNRDHDLALDYSTSSQHYIGNPGGVLLSSARSASDRKWTRDAWSAAYNGRFDIGQLELKYYEEKYERLTYPANATYATGSTNKVGDARFVTGLGAHMLTVGSQWTNDRLTNNELGGGRSGSYGTRRVTEMAYFAEDEWELVSQKLFLTLGARLTDNDFFGKHVSPRAYLVFNHDSRWTFKGGVATGYKSPKISQIDSTTGSQRGGGSDQFLIVGNPDLQPEKSTNFEIGALYGGDGPLSGGATLFFNDFSNKIISTSSYYFDNGGGGRLPAYCDSGAVGTRDCPGWATWLNARGATIRGIELDGRWAIGKTLSLKANYTYTDSRIDAGNVTIDTPAGPRSFGDTLARLDGNSLVGIPKHNGSVTLDYRPTDALSGFVRANYEGQITRVSFEDNTVDKSDKDLITLDAGVSYALSRYLTLNFVVDNITDAKRFDVNDDTGAYRYSERGRSYYAGLNARF